MTAGTSDGVCRMTLKNSKKNLCLSFIAKKNALSKTEKQADIARWSSACAGTGTAEKNLANVAEAIYLYSIAADNYFVTEG